MAEEAATLDPSIARAPDPSPIVDQPTGVLDSMEAVRTPPQTETPSLLFVRDGTGNKVLLLWEQAKDFSVYITSKRTQTITDNFYTAVQILHRRVVCTNGGQNMDRKGSQGRVPCGD